MWNNTVKVQTAFLLFCSSLFLSQNNIRFAYEYTYAIDSTKIDSVNTELMYLDISPEGSRFYSRDVFVSDSLTHSAIKNQNNGSVRLNNLNGKIRDVVKKLYPDYNVFTTTNLGLQRYTYEDERKLKWEVINEKKIINGFDVQKAKLTAFGRRWVAWFATEYPFQDGPHKFYGLPGIIVSIEDDKKGHHFSLKQVKILKPEEFWPLETDKRKLKNTINTSREKYKEVFVTYRNDPLKDWRTSSAGGSIRLQATHSGNPMSIKDVENFTKNKLKKENNILELDLVK